MISQFDVNASDVDLAVIPGVSKSDNIPTNNPDAIGEDGNIFSPVHDIDPAPLEKSGSARWGVIGKYPNKGELLSSFSNVEMLNN